MGQYLIDNNVISDFFSGAYSEKGMAFVAGVIDNTPLISVITEIEALSWVSPDKQKEAILRNFVGDAIVLPLSEDIVAACVKLRRERRIKTPDAIIAATAMVHQLTLVTADLGFAGMPGLDVFNPKTI